MTVRLEANPPEGGFREGATLVFRNMTGGLQLFRRQDTALPHEITVTLPLSGEYRVVVGESTGSAILYGVKGISETTASHCKPFRALVGHLRRPHPWSDDKPEEGGERGILPLLMRG